MDIEIAYFHDAEDNEDVFLAYMQDRCVGNIRVSAPFDGNRCAAVHASSVVRRMGIATRLYDAAEAFLAERGQVLVPSACLTEDATRFWAARDLARLQSVHPDRDGSYVAKRGLPLAWFGSSEEPVPDAEPTAPAP